MLLKNLRNRFLHLVCVMSALFLSTANLATSYSSADQASLNLIWVNKTAEKTELVCQSKEVLTEILNTAQNWRQKNDNLVLNFWYDSEFIDEHALDTMHNLMAQEMLAGITFIDIRSLDVVRNHPWAFSTRVSFYPRMDVLRFAIAREYLKNPDSRRYFAYADVSAYPTNLTSLIEASKVDLDRDGIVMGSAEGFKHAVTDHELEFENGFMILDKNKSDLLDAIEDILLASFFRFTEREENLPFMSAEAIYKALTSFLQIYCNRHIQILIGDWNNDFMPIQFDEKHWGVSVEIWTRNFFYANLALVSLAGVTSFPNEIPTITEQILRPSQFTKEVAKVPATAAAVANFILNAEKLDGIAFAKGFEKEHLVDIVKYCGLSKSMTLEILQRYFHKSY